MKKALLAIFLIAILVSCNKSDSPADIVEDPGVTTYPFSDLIGDWYCNVDDPRGCDEILSISDIGLYYIISCGTYYNYVTDANCKYEGNKLVLGSSFFRRTYTIKELTATSMSVNVYIQQYGTNESKVFQKMN
jgi:hypothetical protein